MLNQIYILTFKLKVTKKILNLKSAIMWEYQNIKTFLQKVINQIGQNNFLLLKKLKILYYGHM